MVGRVTKIEQYHLESEVNELLDDGYSVEKIANVISMNHPEIKDLQNLSHMSIQRYKNNRSKNEIITLYQSGDIENVTNHLIQELLDETNGIKDEIIDIRNKAYAIYNKDESSDKDKLSALTVALKGIESQTKTLESRINSSTRKIQQSNTQGENKSKQYNVLMIQMGDKLCDKCKKKLIEELGKM